MGEDKRFRAVIGAAETNIFNLSSGTIPNNETALLCIFKLFDKSKIPHNYYSTNGGNIYRRGSKIRGLHCPRLQKNAKQYSTPHPFI